MPALDTRLTPLGESVCGGLAGGLTRFLVAPLDVVKVRCQLAGADLPPRGVAGAARAILREEGARALWRGSGAGIALWVSFMAVQFPAYGACRRGLRRAFPGAPGALEAACAGGAAGAAATLATYPLDWARTQLASGAVGAAGGGAWAGALRPALEARGAAAWYAGARPAVAAVLPSAALTFALHEQLRALWDGWGGAGALLAAAGAPPELAAQARAAACGGAAGLAAKLATHPLDTAKKLLQAQGAFRPPRLGAPHPRYRGATHALRSLAAGPGGWRSWFRGLPPALWKAGASTALAFWAYEGAARLLGGAGPPFAAGGGGAAAG